MRTIANLLFCSVLLAGCSNLLPLDTTGNQQYDPKKALDDPGASHLLKRNRGEKDVLMMLALSGGGSRAAYFSGSVMLGLEKAFKDVDLLREVDVISSVSGGSLPAAYYAISHHSSVVLDSAAPKPICETSDLFRCSENDGLHRLALVAKPAPDQAAKLTSLFDDPHDRRRFEYLVTQPAVVSNRSWDEATVKELMSRDYISRWIGNWFWPNNIAKYWLSPYNRSNIMAETLAANLYDAMPSGLQNLSMPNLTFRDLNPERPYLLLNSTDVTAREDKERPFGSVFAFTDEDFRDRLNSDLASYEVARAVMASAAFPVVFNDIALRRHGATEQYMHVFDGGNSDNLGLTSIKRVLLEPRNRAERYRKIVVILVDSFAPSKGVDKTKIDGRCQFCYVVDLNVIDAVDALLEMNREGVIQDFKNMATYKDCSKGNLPADFCGKSEAEKDRLTAELKKKTFFYQIGFKSSKNKDELREIPTDFKISDKHKALIDDTVAELINDRNPCLRRVKAIVKNNDESDDTQCPEDWVAASR